MASATWARFICFFAVSIGAVCYFYLPYLSQTSSIAPWYDTIYLTGPIFCDISRSVLAHAQPLMNWSTFEAVTYNAHVAPYYPFYLFGWFDFCSAAASAQAADIIAVVHVAILFITTASLIRATGAGLAAAVVGAGIAAALPNTREMMNFPTFIAAAAWLPLAVEGLVRLYYRRQFLLGATLLAIGMGAMLTAGPGTNLLAPMVFTGIVLTIHVGFRLFSKSDGALALRIFAGLIIAGAATSVLVLASTLNLYEHLIEFIRWTKSGPVIGTGNTGDITEILDERQSLRTLSQIILPTGGPYTAGTFFLGPGVLMLASLGVARFWSNVMVRAFALLAIVAIAVVFLVPPTLVLLWALIPGLNHTRHLSLLATPITLSASVLAAYGLEGLADKSQGWNWRVVLPTMLAAVGILILGIAGGSGTTPRSSYSSDLLMVMVVAVAAMGFAAAIASGAIRQLALVALLLLNFIFVYGSLSRTDGTPLVTRSPVWKSVETAAQYIKASDPEPGRIALDQSVSADNGLGWLQAGSILTYDDLPTFSHSTSPRLYWKFQHEISLVAKDNYAPYGGKYLLSVADQPETLGHKVFDAGPIKVYELNGYRPLIDLVCPTGDGFEQLDRDVTSQPHGELPLLAGPHADALTSIEDGKSDCPPDQRAVGTRLVRSDNAVHFTVPIGPTRLLIINLPPYSDWHLEVGGVELPLLNLQEDRIVTLLPRDVSGMATLAYRPNGYLLLLRITLVGWFIAIVALVAQLAHGWRKRMMNLRLLRQAILPTADHARSP